MDGEAIYVETDRGGIFADTPDWLYTDGVGPCIAVAYLNKTCRYAGLIHESHVADSDKLEKFLDQAKSRTRSGDKVKVRVFGGDSSVDAEIATANREAAEHLVRDAFPNVEPTLSWINDGSSYEVEVFTASRKISGKRVLPRSPDEDGL
jgi:hypothetical protein